MTVSGRGGGIGQDWSEHEKKALTCSSRMPRTQKRGASDGGSAAGQTLGKSKPMWGTHQWKTPQVMWHWGVW